MKKPNEPNITENPYWDEILKLDADPHSTLWKPDGWGISRLLKGEMILPPREELVQRYAWAIPNPEALAFLKKTLEGKSLVELGAGTGYWAWQLTQLGIEVEAYDLTPSNKWYKVEKGSFESVAESSADTLMLCWPERGPMAAKSVEVFRGKHLLYIGEGAGGCTADDKFFEIVDSWHYEASFHHITYGGLKDSIHFYSRA